MDNNTIKFINIDQSNIAELIKFDLNFKEDPDHFLLSIKEHNYDFNNHEYFILKIEDNTIAKCGIALNPPEEDICAYGLIATNIFYTYKDEFTASLINDLVNYAQRGLHIQLAMIKFRLELLKARKCKYAFAGIIQENKFSKINYIKSGFEKIGEKTIKWKNGANDIVELYGVNL